MGKFKVGDLVRVREWDDMKEEFGSCGDLRIYCNCSFWDMMKSTCGDVCTIEDLTDSGNYMLSGEKESGWIYSDDMLYPAITYREYVEKVEPERIDHNHLGGVKGCPFSLPGIYTNQPYFCEFPCYDDDICKKCWDRYLTEKEYKEYERRKKEEKKEMEFKVGDYVRVVKATDGDGANWVPGMDRAVGKIYKIKQADKDKTCNLEGIDLFWFPFEALELATPKDMLSPFCTVKMRNGDVYLFDGKNKVVNEDGFVSIGRHDENLYSSLNDRFDVIDICSPSNYVTELSEFLTNRGECIWKREEVVEITAEEAAKKLSEQYPGQTVKIVV